MSPTEANAAAAHWRAEYLRPVSARENSVHAMRLPDGRVAALRLHRPGFRGAQAISAELCWTLRLGEAGIAVPTPLAMPDGGWVARLECGRLASAVGWLDGTPRATLAHAGTDDRVGWRALGRMVARIHAVPDGFSKSRRDLRPQWGQSGLVGPHPTWGPFWSHPALTDTDSARLAALRLWAAEFLSAEEPIDPGTGMIHADLLGDNILCTDHGLALIDFDDCGPGHRLYDLATALVTDATRPGHRARADELLSGYSMVLDPGPEPERRLDGMVLIRALASAGWTAGRLPGKDPRHRLYIDRALKIGTRVAPGICT